MTLSMHGNYLVQAVIAASGISSRPHVVSVASGGKLHVAPMERETPSTLFFNGALVLVTDHESIGIVESCRTQVPATTLRAVHKALASAGKLASEANTAVVPLLLPFDASPCRPL